MRSTSISLILLAASVSAVPAVYRRQDPSSLLPTSTIVPISTAAQGISSLEENASSLASATGASLVSGDMPSSTSASAASSVMSGEPALPTASSPPLGINCPGGYMSGSYNVTREVAGSAGLIVDQIGDFLNTTWQTQNTVATQTGMTGVGNTVGATRVMTVNDRQLQETLTQYVRQNDTGALNMTWILSNGPISFGDQSSTLASYVQQLNLIPSMEDPDNSTIEWTTVFCAGSIDLFEGFFQQLHEPPLNAIANSTEAAAQESMASESMVFASRSSLAQSLQSLAESASLAAASLTAMPTSSEEMMPTESGISFVTVTVTQ